MNSPEIKISQSESAPDAPRSRIALNLDNQEISRVCLVHHQIIIRQTAVKMGGIADVFTEPAHRMKGYARRLLDRCLGYMKEQGADVSMLFGITGLYPKFGYAPCMGRHCLRIATTDARTAPTHYAHRQAQRADACAIASIYHENNSHRSGTVCRDPACWKWFRKGSTWHTGVQAHLITDKDQAVGYLAYDDVKDQFVVFEVGASRRDAYPTILALAGKLAASMRKDQITFILPANHPLVSLCRRFGCRLESTFLKDGGPMGRIINQSSLFEKLVQPLSTAARTSWLKEDRITLEIRTELESTFIKLDQGRASLTTETDHTELVELGQGRLWQLLLGYRSTDDLVSMGEIQLSDKAARALGTLFPPTAPFMWSADHF